MRRQYVRGFALSEQSAHPSQAHSRLRPYSNRIQADELQFREYTRDVGTEGNTPSAPYVLTAFDARPINTIDFVKTFTTTEQAAAAGAAAANFDYVVPAGRVFIARRLRVRAWLNAASQPVREAATGKPLFSLIYSFLINGNPVDQENLVRIDQAICGTTTDSEVDIPLYFLAQQRETVRMRFTTSGVFSFIQPILTGNLLFREGLSVVAEPGTKQPLPTRLHYERRASVAIPKK